MPYDEDPVDPKAAVDAECAKGCTKEREYYQRCAEKWASLPESKQEDSHCKRAMYKYWSCVDKCSLPKVFAQLK